MDLNKLKQELPFKWRVQSTNQHGSNCVAYIDARDVQDLLDDVVGAENWQVKYEEHKGNLFASIGIMVEENWVWKSDCGTESQVEKQKGEASDAFKRAAVMWGIGRFLYSLKIIKIKEVLQKGVDRNNKPKYVPAQNGKQIWDINKYCNDLHKGKPQPKQQEDRKPALTIEQFEIAKKSTPKEIQAVLNQCRMSAEQKAELTILTKF